MVAGTGDVERIELRVLVGVELDERAGIADGVGNETGMHGGDDRADASLVVPHCLNKVRIAYVSLDEGHVSPPLCLGVCKGRLGTAESVASVSRFDHYMISQVS